MNAIPDHSIFADTRFRVANDDLEIVPAFLAARRTEQRLMAFAAILAVAVLTLTLVNGYLALQPVPDATFAFRV